MEKLSTCTAVIRLKIAKIYLRTMAAREYRLDYVAY